MLVITREAGQSLRIGEEIEVRILEVKGGKVRIGVDAPTHVPVHRNEVYDRIHGQQEGGRTPAQSK